MDFIDIINTNEAKQQQISSDFTKAISLMKNRQKLSQFRILKINTEQSQINLSTFDQDFSSLFSNIRKKFFKIKKTSRNTYTINVEFNLVKNEFYIQASYITQTLQQLQISYVMSLHLISLFSFLNNGSNFCFKIDPKTLQITISSGLILFSRSIDNNKLDNIVNHIINTFQDNYSQIQKFTSGFFSFNDQQVVLCEGAQKCIRITQQILTNSCIALDQIAVTKNYDQDSKQQVSKINKSNKNIKIHDLLNKTICVSKTRKDIQVNVKDLQKLLLPQKQIGNKGMNNLCSSIKIKNKEQLNWIHFVSNSNNKIQVTDAQLIFKEQQVISKRSIVNKIPKTENGQKQSNNIKKIYNNLKYKNCVNILKSYIINDQKEEKIYSDYCRYGSLANYIKKNKLTMPLKTKLYFLLQIATGLKFLQSQQIIHMDIKPSNVLIATDLWAKITDFGQAIFQGDQKSNGWTAPYVATQVLNNTRIDNRVDIYSFGVTTYEVLTNKQIFPRKSSTMQNFSEVHKLNNPEIKIVPESLFRLGPHEIMQYLYQLITRCVNPIKNERLNIEQIILILKSIIGLIQYVAMPNKK